MNRIRNLVKAACLFLALLSLTPYAPVSNLLTDIPSHFVLQYAIGSIMMGFILLIFKIEHRYFFFLVCAFALNISTLSPFLERVSSPAQKHGAFKILQVNVLTQNHKSHLLEALIEEQKPDIIAIAEINPAFHAMAKNLSKKYPYQTSRHKVALLSRFPAKDISPPAPSFAPAHISALAIKLNGNDLNIVTLHTPTPLGDLRGRDAELAQTIKFLRSSKNPVILLGDINATPWCPAVQHLTQTTGLRHARENHGLLPSWPVWLPFSFLRIPIDHVFVSAEIEVLDYRLGSNVGSDHLPTLGVFRLSDPQIFEK